MMCVQQDYCNEVEYFVEVELSGQCTVTKVDFVAEATVALPQMTNVARNVWEGDTRLFCVKNWVRERLIVIEILIFGLQFIYL